MSTAVFLQRCLDAGVDAETAVRMAAAFEATAGEMIAGALAQAERLDEDRKRKQRERKQRSRSRDVTGQDVTERDVPGQAVTPSKTKGSVSPLHPSSSPKTQPTHPPSPPTGAHGSAGKVVSLAKPNGFARFWEAYPNKVGRRAAETAYERALRRADAETMYGGLERALACRRWAEGFIPNPATWLNQDRWLDEPDETARAPPMAASDVQAEARRRLLQELS